MVGSMQFGTEVKDMQVNVRKFVLGTNIPHHKPLALCSHFW